MREYHPLSRRRFLRGAAATAAFTPLGLPGAAEASAPRELAAVVRATEWINSPPLTAAMLAGKVVLVDFWTFTCINWLHTLPYVRAWARKYGNRIVIIGVHTPEFGFERSSENVRRAVKQMRIDYPVVIDNDYSIWRAFRNDAWPALYFIDTAGRIRHHHLGEGQYRESELALQLLLAEGGAGGVGAGVVTVEGAGVEAAPDWDNLKSPETYLGHARTERFSSPGGAAPGRRRVYAAPPRLTLNQWALTGEWTMTDEAAIVNDAAGRISCRFHARDLHLVMGPSRSGSSVGFRVSIDGLTPGPAHGVDVDSRGKGEAVEQRLYQLVRQPGPIVDRTFEIEFAEAGVGAFAFTFG